MNWQRFRFLALGGAVFYGVVVLTGAACLAHHAGVPGFDQHHTPEAAHAALCALACPVHQEAALAPSAEPGALFTTTGAIFTVRDSPIWTEVQRIQPVRAPPR